ncbi:PDZ domain-containing protein [Nocardioides panacisoli]|uniref:YlbL family protein n=1 Tax=Nocardioides panacisoli TaxID=627624 RepID=UPI001C63A59B|nr:S16 family serine protease [Nocardioides panacisoli]QYJ05714.1 PDZ domain-containing protein [Nocardioides panacisoli]
MSQRWIAAFVAVPLLVALLLVAAVAPLPFAIYSPGPTFDVLAQDADDAELIQIDGDETEVYNDDGEIRFTTVRATARSYEPGLFELLGAWADADRAVVPHDVAHPPSLTADEEEERGQVQMTTSQDVAKAVALGEAGYDLDTAIQVQAVAEDGAANGKLLAGDVFLSANGQQVSTPQDVVDAVEANGSDDPVDFRVRRDGEQLDVAVAPEDVDGEARVGISVAQGFDFPFEIKLRVNEAIGGPSAGLMFALAIYDTLTPGSLSDGEVVAGTGELAPDGTVGPIGGIEQKIAGAEDAGAELFFVPPDNCRDVTALDPDLRLVKAETMHDARLALEDWAADRDADLPSC